ncbi:MAG: phytoene desaturase family protein [Cytophagaceae bacterium]|nr:phytoene desaturase family protein [Cytophagaceae bacterium]MDW8457083.1 1-hydroxycarotenoid 3,4-desaturase CrtD [Cytophagaceae bacterium]
MNSSKSQKTCAIIGAGIAGIAAAIRMAAKGYKVDVFDKNDTPGGKLSSFNLGSYRFDFGPSLFTLPHLVEELFLLCNKKPEQYFSYTKVEPGHLYFFEDGTRIEASSDINSFAQQIENHTRDKSNVVINYLKKQEEKFNITKEVFLQHSLHDYKNYLSLHFLKALCGLHKIEALTTMHEVNQKTFCDSRTIRIFDRYATYNGSNPYQAPATLTMIPHIEFGFGVYFPKGGMYSITQSLLQLAMDMGVRFHYSTLVESILLHRNTATGIQCDNTKLCYDKIFCNADVHYAYQKLLPQKIGEKYIKQERSSSALVFYWGIKKIHSQLALHNILFSEHYEQEFHVLFKEKKIHQDPTIYINIASKYAPEDAPQGCETWFVMINAPHQQGQNWDAVVAETRQNVIRKINRMLQTDIEKYIEAERILTPAELERKTLSAQGSIYGSSSNSVFSAFLRHPNRSPHYKNLFFCGGSVHPGGGIPLCLLSAKIATELATRND